MEHDEKCELQSFQVASSSGMKLIFTPGDLVRIGQATRPIMCGCRFRAAGPAGVSADMFDRMYQNFITFCANNNLGVPVRLDAGGRATDFIRKNVLKEIEGNVIEVDFRN